MADAERTRTRTIDGETVRAVARDLVAIPSHDDERAAGEAIADWLREHTDMTVERSAAGVIARRGEAADRIALVGHHDVVPPDDSQVDDGEYVVEEREARSASERASSAERSSADGREAEPRAGDGRLYGRGSADMKGSLAAAMCAVRDADAPCTFASFRGEERGGVGARRAIADGFAPERAVVGEGSTGYSALGVTDVAVAHKGRRGSTVTVRGKSAHASEPEAGVNAVYRATDAVDAVRELDAPAAEILGQSLSGSVVVTEIEGGSAWNVVPDRCEFTVDERTVPGERADLARVEDEAEGVEWSVDQDLPPMACDDEAFAERALAAASGAQDGAPDHVAKPHATDAGWLAEAGTACVVVGAAEPGEAHTADESVDLAVLDRCYEIYRETVERIGTA